MGEEIKDLNKEVDKLEAAAKKYASKDTVISIGGYEFTPAKLMVAFTLISSLLGGLYGVFEVYKDYMGMKKKIADYVSPDLTEIYKKLEVFQTQNFELQKQAEKSVQYTQDIKNDLKGDIRRLEGVVDGVERGSKQSQRETDLAVKDVRGELREVQGEMRKNQQQIDQNIKQTNQHVDQAIKQTNQQVDQTIKQLNKEIDTKIQKALDNPLAR